jgi:hypothetical protein
MWRPATGGSLNSVPNKVETFEPAIRRRLIPHLMPDPLLGVEARLVRGQKSEMKAGMRLYKEINLFPFMPSGPVYIEPDRIASQVTAYMFQARKKSFPISVRPSDHPPSAQQRSDPSKEIQPLAMLARRRNPKPSSPLCPSYPQARVERKPRFVLKDDGFLRAQSSEFFLTPDESAWPLRSSPEDTYSLPASVDSLTGASRTEPDEPSGLSRTDALNGPQGWDHPSGPAGVRMPREISPGPLPAAFAPVASSAADAPAASRAPGPLSPDRLPGASRDSSSDALSPTHRLSIPDAGPPVPARAPRSLFPCGLPGSAVPWQVNALGSLLDALPLRFDFS